MDEREEQLPTYARMRQQRLFSLDNALRTRHDPAFFKQLPREPGVYRMYDQQGVLLYVGKAKDLRARINSYRHVNPDKHSGKVVRLVNLVTEIQYDICASETDALLRENELIRLYRPAFNWRNKHPERYLFIEIRSEPPAPTCPNGGLRLKLIQFRDPDEVGALTARQPLGVYGAFKGIKRTREAVAALGRLLHCAEHPIRQPLAYPRKLTAATPPQDGVVIGFGDGVTETKVRQRRSAVGRLLKGTSRTLLDELHRQLVIEPMVGTEQMARLHAADLVLVEAFYEIGPKRNRALVKKFGLTGHMIDREEIDDLLALKTVRD